MNQEIQNWLTSPERDYDQGVALMHKYHRNKILLKIFNRPKSKYNIDKLQHELNKMVHTTEQARAPYQANWENGPSFLKKKTEVITIDPDVLQESKFALDEATLAELEKIETEWKALFKEAKNLHLEKLNDETPEKDRAAACIRITEIREELLPKHYWPLVKYIKENGRLPEGYGKEEKKDDFDFGTTDPVLLMKKVQNIRSRISKDKDNPAKVKQVELWHQQITWIENFLKQK